MSPLLLSLEPFCVYFGYNLREHEVLPPCHLTCALCASWTFALLGSTGACGGPLRAPTRLIWNTRPTAS